MNVAPVHTAGGASGMHEIASITKRRASMKGTAGCEGKIRLLVLTALYPNAVQPRHGLFVEERLRRLVATGRIEATVVAPVPWFPLRHRRFGAYAAYARVPSREKRIGIDVHHPRYPAIPKVGMRVAPALMARALLPMVRKLATGATPFDVIDAHYFYPDGVAAMRIGSRVGKPVVITARGSDVTLFPRYRGPRRNIRWAARHAAAVITVSQALKDRLSGMGVDAGKVTVLRNGVDLERFAPCDATPLRTRLGLAGPVWLTVGHLVELKGVHIAIEALAQIPEATLLVAGEGPDAPRLRGLVQRLGLADRVQFLGGVAHADLCTYYNAADALIHASSREGMPNVVLESLACGTPVVAAPFDGVTEVVHSPAAGEVADERSAAGLAAAWRRLRERSPTRAATRAAAEQLGWEPVVQAQVALYAHVLAATAAGVRL